jgi:hypothetical protein
MCFEKRRYVCQLSQCFAVTQYLGCAALLFIRFQICHTSENIGSRCGIMIHIAFFENIWRWINAMAMYVFTRGKLPHFTPVWRIWEA